MLLSKKAGAKFIISPDSNPEVIRLTKKHRMISIPGALTPSEITQAHRAGADFIKLFPSRSMGAGYLKDIAAPLSHVRFLAVGGINMDNMEEYWNSGACGFGIGSYIVDKEQIRQGNFETIEKRAREYIDRIAKLPKR